jgi:HlyD family secretion protein
LSPSDKGAPAVEGGAPVVVPAPQDVLRPGMSAQAEIEVEHLDDAVVVPLAAVLEAQKTDDGEQPDRVVIVDIATGTDLSHAKDAVYAVSVRPVKLGPSEGEAIAVLSGLQKGERVVEGPYRVLKSLKDGDKVRQVEDAKKLMMGSDGATEKAAAKP